MHSREVAGVGIGLRREFHEQILGTERRVDWLEVISETVMSLSGRSRYVLDACLERWPMIPHGVAASMGTERSEAGAYDTQLAKLSEHMQAAYISDHLCYTSLSGHESFDLLPLPFTHEAIDAVAQRAQQMSTRVGRPMLLENITYYAIMPGAQMSEDAFLRRALEASGCKLLLDLNNVYLNALNHGEDPKLALARLPLEHVGQIHLAGYMKEGELLIDTHSCEVSEPVWDLYRAALAKTGPVPTLIEWDQDIPSLDAVLDEADKARAIMTALSKATAQ
jgi:uncharacterized protein